MSEQLTSNHDFDADLGRLEQVRIMHKALRPALIKPDTYQVALENIHDDRGFLLGFIDRLWREYMTVLRAQPAESPTHCDGPHDWVADSDGDHHCVNCPAVSHQTSDDKPAEPPRYYCKNCHCADCGNTRAAAPTAGASETQPAEPPSECPLCNGSGRLCAGEVCNACLPRELYR